jgi:hypothetical protein
MTETKRATFTTAQAAAAVMSRMSAAGLVEGWNDQIVFGKVYVRFQRNRRWYDLLNSDLAAWGL